MAQNKPTKKRPSHDELFESHYAAILKHFPGRGVNLAWVVDGDTITSKIAGGMAYLFSYIDEENQIRHKID